MTDSGSTCTACGATYRDIVTTCPNCQVPIDAGLPRVGEIFDSRYEVVERLGAGGMGEVFKARHIHLGSFRALKVMRTNLVADESSRRRFNREARLATRIHHENVAVVYDFAVAANGSYYIVSEFVNGVTLRQWNSSHELFTEAAALDIAIQTLRGLEHLHRNGILHRDVSSDNIMISQHADGSALVKIIDLGLAKLLTDTPAGEATTRAGLFLGNPRYSSPEQLGALPDGAEIDARSDIYSFGVVLYELLTGAAPFASSTPQGYAAKHLIERPPALTPRPGKRAISEELQAVVWKALEKKRENRYASAQELADALARFLVVDAPIAPATREEPASDWREASGIGEVSPQATTPISPTPDARPAASDIAPEPEPIPVAIPLRERTPPPAPLPPLPPPPLPEWPVSVAAEPERASWQWRYIAAGLAIAAVLVEAVAYWRSDSPAEVTTTTAPAPSPEPPPSTAPSPAIPASAAPLAVTGDLVINAMPWGRIISVHDGAKEWISGAAVYTPRTLKLPPGNYTVALLGPDGTQQSVVVRLTSTEPAYVRIDFHPSEGGRTANSSP